MVKKIKYLVLVLLGFVLFLSPAKAAVDKEKISELYDMGWYLRQGEFSNPNSIDVDDLYTTFAYSSYVDDYYSEEDSDLSMSTYVYKIPQ